MEECIELKVHEVLEKELEKSTEDSSEASNKRSVDIHFSDNVRVIMDRFISLLFDLLVGLQPQE